MECHARRTAPLFSSGAPRLSYGWRSMTAMTEPERPEHLDGLRRLAGFPTNEDSAVRVVVRYFADRGIVCAEHEARSIVQEGISLGQLANQV